MVHLLLKKKKSFNLHKCVDYLACECLYICQLQKIKHLNYSALGLAISGTLACENLFSLKYSNYIY